MKDYLSCIAWPLLLALIVPGCGEPEPPQAKPQQEMQLAISNLVTQFGETHQLVQQTRSHVESTDYVKGVALLLSARNNSNLTMEQKIAIDDQIHAIRNTLMEKRYRGDSQAGQALEKIQAMMREQRR